jgi:hypothetical protein
MHWAPLLRTRAEGWTILVRLIVGLVVFLPEGIQKLAFPEILGSGRSPANGSRACPNISTKMSWRTGAPAATRFISSPP